MLKVTKSGKWQLYWGYIPLPTGAEAIGTVQRETLETGALLRLATGIYVQGNAGAIRTLPQREVKAAITRSEAASALGSMTSEKKAATARENGKRGGRPRKNSSINPTPIQEQQTMSTNQPQRNYQLQIYTWPAMRGAPVNCRISYHDTVEEAIAHLDSQTEPYHHAVLARRDYAGHSPCDWEGNFVPTSSPWPMRRGTNGEHPAYLAYVADKENLKTEILRRHAEQGGGILDITHAVLQERHPEITQSEMLAREIVGL